MTSSPKGPDKPEPCALCGAQECNCCCEAGLMNVPHACRKSKPPAQVGGGPEDLVNFGLNEDFLTVVLDEADKRYDNKLQKQPFVLGAAVAVGYYAKEISHSETGWADTQRLIERLERELAAKSTDNIKAYAEIGVLHGELAEAKDACQRVSLGFLENGKERDKLRAENEAAAELISTAEQRGYLSGKAYFEKDLHAARAESHALCFTISETQGALNRANEEIARWKAKYIDARQSGYAEGIEERDAALAELALWKNCTIIDERDQALERIASLEKALEHIAQFTVVKHGSFEFIGAGAVGVAREALGKK